MRVAALYVAALYDVHGNLPALDAVLLEADADLILVGGDVVAGPWPSETLERLRGLGERVHFIRGNADRELTRAPGPPRKGGPPPELLDFVRERLSDEQLCHTHVQFDRRVSDFRLVNAGSVGMPYEAEPGAYWSLLGPDVDLRRTEYEAGDVAATGWPDEWPVETPEDATAFFEKLSRARG